MTNKELINLAKEARKMSYSPYSGFSVGACLLTKSGKVYLGANIENSAFSPTVCAERVAFFKAVFDGEREFEKIAVVGGRKDSDSEFPPCGVCRQVMAEFCHNNFEIILESDGEEKVYRLSELLPKKFDKIL